LDFTTVVKDERLREISTGRWSGLLKAEMDPDHLQGSGTNSWFFRAPGGETYAQIAARLGDWLSERRAGEKLVVVSHGVSGRILRGLYAGTDPDAALAEDSPQDCLFRLHGGNAERIMCV
jgi:broad specificity phosphatase PhoE